MRYTQNLSLPIFEAGDRVDLLTSYNAAMQILDQYVYGLPTDTAVAQALAAANAASAAATAAQATATSAANAAAAVETKLTKTNTAASVSDLSNAVMTSGGYFAVPDPQNSGE